jgi:hypothetical protein
MKRKLGSYQQVKIEKKFKKIKTSKTSFKINMDNKSRHWDRLPSDVQEHIGTFLTIHDLKNVCWTSKTTGKIMRWTRISSISIDTTVNIGVLDMFPNIDEIVLKDAVFDPHEWMARIGQAKSVTFLSDISFSKKWASCLINITTLSIHAVQAKSCKRLALLTHLQVLTITKSTLTNELFQNMNSLNRLTLRHCEGLTEEAMCSVTALQELKVLSCGFEITDRFIAPLIHLTILNLTSSPVQHMTNEAFKRLSKLEVICSGVNKYVTDEVFQYLPSLKYLDIGSCSHITDAAFCHLSGLIALFMGGCNQTSITDAAFKHLSSLKFLLMIQCTQHTITDKAIQCLPNLQMLIIDRCNQFTDAAFVNSDIGFLSMKHCRTAGITDHAFKHLKNLFYLDISYCTQFTNAAFAHFGTVMELTIDKCNKQITDEALEHLSSIKHLSCRNMSFSDRALRKVERQCKSYRPRCANFNRFVESVKFLKPWLNSQTC